MSSLATKMATKMAEKKLKSELKNMTPTAPAGSGPKTRGGDSGGGGGSTEGCCRKLCGLCCRSTSPWTQVICWAMIALVLATIALWIGGAFLSSPADDNTSTDVCGINITIPLVDKDPYVFYLGSTGLIATIMIVGSCICCCSCVSLFSEGCPKLMRICGSICLIIALLVISVFVGWVALGTYFVIKINGSSSVCRNTIIYLVLLYVYLILLTLAFCVSMAWKCNDWRVSRGTHSGVMRAQRVRKPPK